MKAARLHSFGAELSFDEVEEPQPGDGEVVVDVLLAAVNPLDLWVSEGSVAGGSQPLPMALGTEGVAQLDGTRVIVNGFGLGVTRDGLYRERAAVPRAALTAVPDGVDDAQAASVSVAGITAKRSFDVGNLAAGETVVVLGASGGVGAVAIRIAKLLGAHVVAVTSSPDKRERLEGLGADAVVVTSLDSLAGAVDGPVDFVLNPLGGPAVALATQLLRPGGRQVLFGRSAGDQVEFSAGDLYRKGVSVIGYGGLGDTPERRTAALDWVLEQVRTGALSIPIDEELPLADVAAALARVRDGKVVGKLVVRPG